MRRLAVAAWLVAAPALAQPAALPENVLPLTVRTPHGGFNRLVVSVTLCRPGTTICTTIDDVMVDTGSTGLRIEASALPAALHLPALVGPGGAPLAECLHFVHDTAWGPLQRADVRLGGLTMRALPLQVIADDGGPQPAACPRSDVKATANATLGIGPLLLDCLGACVQSAERPSVFVRRDGTWEPVRGPVAPAFRLPNPVSRLPRHANGLVIELPAPPASGAVAVTGTLTLGIGTAADNALGKAALLHLDATGQFTTQFDGGVYPQSVVDSGSPATLLPQAPVPRCAGLPWAYCATPPRGLAATLVGQDGAAIPASVTVGDYTGLRGRGVGASDALAEASDPTSRRIVFGAPFFLGRRVVVLLDGQTVPGHPEAIGPAYGLPGR